MDYIEHPIREWRHYHYKNTTYLLLSLIAFYFLTHTPEAQIFIAEVGRYGPIGAFVTGMFFISTFTIAQAAVVLYHLAKVLSPVELALFAGAGAVIGDFIVFRYVRDKVFFELKPLLNKIEGSYHNKLFHSPLFAWFLPITGLLFLVLPLAEEVEMSLLGLTKLKSWQFMLVSFLLNFIGILLVVTVAQHY